jgi:hypothetical protein
MFLNFFPSVEETEFHQEIELDDFSAQLLQQFTNFLNSTSGGEQHRHE